MGTAYPGMVLITVLLSFFAFGPAVQAADDLRYLYEWKDDQGVVNVTDRLDKVPPKYRSKAKQLLQPGPGKEEQRSEEIRNREQSRDLDTGTSLERDEIRKAEWQQRMLDARRRLAGIEERLQQTEKKLKALQEKYGFGLYGYPPEDQDELDQLTQEADTARRDRDDVRNVIENVLPEEARKAGVPPGWLRE